jgi:hypothetical protein
MKPLDEPLEEARRIIIAFRIHYGIAWEDFQKLEAFDAKYRGLTARRWVEVIQRGVEPNGQKRKLTLDLAELIVAEPATILKIVPPRHRDRSAALLQQPGLRETRNVSDSETLAKEMIARADNGLPKESVEILLGTCKLLLPYHPDEAMAPLRALVYLSSRYLKPVQFISSVMRILPKLQKCTRIHSVDPVLRGQVIAQVAGYLLDRGNIDAGVSLLHHDYVKMVSESSWVAEPLQLSMRRTKAVVEAYSRKNSFDKAIDCIKDATVSGDAGSVRGSAIATSTVWRMQRRFDKAYLSLIKEYESSLDILSEAASNKRLNTGSLLHQFCCVLRGSIARYVVEVKKCRNVDLTKEIGAMKWVLEFITPPALETNEFQPLPDKIRLPTDLEEIRNSCRVPVLSKSDVECLCQLVQALEQ